MITATSPRPRIDSIRPDRQSRRKATWTSTPSTSSTRAMSRFHAAAEARTSATSSQPTSAAAAVAVSSSTASAAVSALSMRPRARPSDSRQHAAARRSLRHDFDHARARQASEGRGYCCRARGTDRNWTRVDRKMSWSPAASSSQQRARVLTDVKARRFAPPPLRGGDGLDAGSAHARPDWLLPTMLTHTPPTCCGRRPVQNDALSGDR